MWEMKNLVGTEAHSNGLKAGLMDELYKVKLNIYCNEVFVV